MGILDFISDIYLPSRVAVSPVYAAALSHAALDYTSSLGQSAKLNDLDELSIAKHLSQLAKRLRPSTVNNRRRMLLTLWRAAADMGYCREPKTRIIRRVAEDHDPPTAWTTEQVGAILYEASRTAGAVDGILASDWWYSLMAVCYWTACRIGALLKTKSTDYDGHSILVRNQKNHRSQLYRLPPCCTEIVDATDPHNRILLWPWPMTRRWFFRKARRIIEASGVPCPKSNGQLFYRLRRTCLSYCAAVDTSLAQHQAGHSSYATTERHYVDPRILNDRQAVDVLPTPPRLSLRIYG